MGNLFEEGRCPRCGFELLDLKRTFCTQCEKELKQQIKHRHKDGMRKKFTMRIGLLARAQKAGLK